MRDSGRRSVAVWSQVSAPSLFSRRGGVLSVIPCFLLTSPASPSHLSTLLLIIYVRSVRCSFIFPSPPAFIPTWPASPRSLSPFFSYQVNLFRRREVINHKVTSPVRSEAPCSGAVLPRRCRARCEASRVTQRSRPARLEWIHCLKSC